VLGALALVVVAIVLIVVLSGGSSSSNLGSGAGESRGLESMFQDDAKLLDASTAVVQRTLTTLKALGVDRLRITVEWAQVAPTVRPTGFDPSDPADYPQSEPLTSPSWARFDRIDLLAAAKGLAVDFDVSGPAPLWATQPGVEPGTTAGDNAPSVAQFRQFVVAVGRRYSGHYKIAVLPGNPKVALPRVSFWTIWNEPNQPGWLAPQYRSLDGRLVPLAPVLYRAYVDAGWAALHATGHGGDKILVGELAPEGCAAGGAGNCGAYRAAPEEEPIPPIPFLRAMYCVNASYRPLRGAAATALGCPPRGSAAAFVKANPALFDATAFTHHPYSFVTAPNVSLPEPSFVPLANLGRLATALDRAFAAYGSHRQIPIYLDEYGYETAPSKYPTPLDLQAAYLNQAAYLAWKNPRVQGLSQFELVDSPLTPNSFQTGLEFADGIPKPSFAAYRLPVWLPHPRVGAGGSVLVWAMLRLAPNDTTQHAQIQWSRSAHGRFQTVAQVSTSNPNGIFETRVKVPRSGVIQVLWRSGGGQAHVSRAAPVTVGG
jgi:hypothetical protein